MSIVAIHELDPVMSIPDEDLIIDLTPVREAGWQVKDLNEWVLCAPNDHLLPDAGWKAHVSARLDDAPYALEVVRDVSLAHGVTFKFMPTAERALLINSKGALRTSSGKIACIYAVDADTLHTIVEDLREGLRGIDGPDILTDLRCGPEPVFIRWGGFYPLWTYRRGNRVLGVRSPNGAIIPDEGRFRWVLPDWVTLPEWAQRYQEARGKRVMNLPCTVRSSLHFSAAGGVYVGEMRDTGEQVLVKEARPFAGLDDYRNDAIERLRLEHGWLKRLGPRGLVPKEYGMHEGTRHHYLVREMLDGETAAETMWLTWPWNQELHPTQEHIDRYRDWAFQLLDRVADLVDEVHEEGGAIHDLHPGNLFLEAGTGAVKLFDLETLTPVTSNDPPPVIAPEYLRHEGGDGYARDAYAYRVLAHALFSPTVLGWPDKGRIAQVRTWISQAFGRNVLDEIDRRTEGSSPMSYGFAVLDDGRPRPVTMPEILQGFSARAEAGDLRGFAPDDPGLDRGTAGLHFVNALHPDHPAPDLTGERVAELHESLRLSQDIDLCLATGSSGILLALLAAGEEVDLDGWERATLALLKEDVVEYDLQHGSPGVAVALYAARRFAPQWEGGEELAHAIAARSEHIVPGLLGGVGLLQGDAGMALFWSLLHRLGVPDAASKIAQFLAPPPPASTLARLPGGFGGLGGWLAAWALAPEEIIDENVREQIASVLSRPLFHKEGGLLGVAGTLVGLELIGRRFPEEAAAMKPRVENELGVWLGGGAGPGLAPYEPAQRKTTDVLVTGTCGIVLLDALRRGSAEVLR